MTIEEKKGESKKKKEAKDGEKNGPIHVVREGAIAALIWRRESSTGFPYYEYSLSRSYRIGASEKTGYKQSYFVRNQAQLIRVIELATKWIEENEAQVHSEPLAA